MVEIHWILLLLIIVVSGSAGFMTCALLTMAKWSDEAIAKMPRQDSGD